MAREPVPVVALFRARAPALQLQLVRRYRTEEKKRPTTPTPTDDEWKWSSALSFLYQTKKRISESILRQADRPTDAASPVGGRSDPEEMPTLKEIQDARERRKERMLGQPAQEHFGSAKPSTEPPSQRVSMMFGMGIVAMAFSYAMLAFRFRSLSNSAGREAFGTGRAEFRAAQQAAETWAGDGRAKAKERASTRGRARQDAHNGQTKQKGGAQGQGPTTDVVSLRWALNTLHLGSEKDLHLQDIKAAYHKEAKKCHPDTGGQTADEEKFKHLRHAYETIVRHLQSEGRG
eukprot:scaffold42434_cov26-Tisochrysis_lutea.AAC.1